VILNERGEPQVDTREFARRVAWFRHLLASANITPDRHSVLAERLSHMEEIGLAWDGSHRRQNRPRIPDYLRSAFGMDYLLRALQRAEQRFDKAELDGALQAFSGEDVLMTDAVARKGKRDRAWELLVACIVAPSAASLQLNGNSSPDIELAYGGARFGMECKMLNSRKPDTLTKSIVDGAKQLEKPAIDYGVVVVNATCLIDHARLDIEARPRMFRSHKEASSTVASMLESGLNPIRSKSVRTRLTSDLASGLPRLKVRKVIFMAQTVVIVEFVPVTITVVSSLGFRTIELPICESFEAMFRQNTQLQD
jgi:hypothetical protein